MGKANSKVAVRATIVEAAMVKSDGQQQVRWRQAGKRRKVSDVGEDVRHVGEDVRQVRFAVAAKLDGQLY